MIADESATVQPECDPTVYTGIVFDKTTFANAGAERHGRRVRTIVLLLMLPIVLIFLLVVQVILPFMGRVVDAVSGEPIQGIRLTLETSRHEGWSVRTDLVDTARSGALGWFFLTGKLRLRGLPLPVARSYWYTANEGDQTTGQEESSAANQILYNPMFARPGAEVGDTRYFPLIVTFHAHGCDRIWKATCMYAPFWRRNSVPLIPVLEDINQCKQIGNPSIQENCRQLNTYWAAFKHVATYDQVQKGKALCADIDHKEVSSTCLQQLELYVAQRHPNKIPFNSEAIEPAPQDMFPDSLAGLPAVGNRHCGSQNPFNGFSDCAGGYGSSLSKEAVAVYIQRWPEGSERPGAWSHIGRPFTQTEELHRGNEVLRFQGHSQSSVQRTFGGPVVVYTHNVTSYVWFSGNNRIEVLFYDPIPQEEQFLSYYLDKFPGTAQPWIPSFR